MWRSRSTRPSRPTCCPTALRPPPRRSSRRRSTRATSEGARHDGRAPAVPAADARGALGARGRGAARARADVPHQRHRRRAGERAHRPDRRLRRLGGDRQRVAGRDDQPDQLTARPRTTQPGGARPMAENSPQEYRPLTREELSELAGEELPERAAMSLINANVAAPVNAAVAANVLSDNSVAFANAQQTANITQGN